MTNHAQQQVMAKEVHSQNLPELLSRIGGSLLLSTYQAGQVIAIGQYDGKPTFGFSRYEKVMGVCKTPTGLALAAKNDIWTLPAQREMAPHLEPKGQHDIVFIARTSHVTGPILAHELAWCSDRLVVVNTLCNCLATIQSPWSFTPIWKPPFITEINPSDRCHINGLAVSQDGLSIAYVTMHGATSDENGWRERKADSGVLFDLEAGEVLCGALSMPHSPRLYKGKLYALNSGKGELIQVDRTTGVSDTVLNLPGFTRGLDFFGDYAFVGLSRIRESAVFGGLPISERINQLRCGVAIVKLATGSLEGFCWFESGVEEIFSVCFLPGFLNPKLVGPPSADSEDHDGGSAIWVVPPCRI